MKNSKQIILVITGLVGSVLFYFLFINKPIALLLISVPIIPITYILTQTKREVTPNGVYLAFLSTLTIWLLIIWVYDIFDWPPDLWDVLLLNMLGLAALEVLFTLVNYLFNREQLSIYLRFEVFLLKIFQVVILILYTLADEYIISSTLATTITIIGLVVLWLKIVQEVSLFEHKKSYRKG